MKSFLLFLTEEKRGRKALTATRDEDAEYIKKELKYTNSSNMSNKIKTLRTKYLKALLNNNIKLVNTEKKSLKDLKQIIDKNKIELPKRQRNWAIHEKDLVDGINELFKNGFFVKDNNKITDTKSYFAEQAGGSNQSDVRVVHKTKDNEVDFFVECKLNLQTAEYFKFGLQIHNDKLQYDHKKFLQGDVKNDKEQLNKLNELFNKHINLNKFLDGLVNNKDIKDYWKLFLQNIKDVNDFISQNDEFKEFSNKISTDYPKGFKDMSNIFDKYCEYYIEKYNTLIDELFELLTYDEILKQKDTFKIQSRKGLDINDNVVFLNIDKLISGIKTAAEEILNDKIITDNKKFNIIVKTIKQIEVKFQVLLEDQGLDPNNFNSLSQLKDLNKMMYFFKMFLSSTGRKSKGKIAIVDSSYDEFGNMQLFPEVQIKDSTLAQMITDFYVKKDKCAYIQIADTILQFDADFNPLQLPKLPLFKDVLTKFNVKLLIDDNLSRISLHINAVEINEDVLKKFNKYSFNKKDNNWIGKLKLLKLKLKS